MGSSYILRARRRAEMLAGRGSAVILAIESSCDETAAAVVKDGRQVLSSVIASQIELHAAYGGVVPEIASRNHVGALDRLADEALSAAGISAGDVDAVAVTYGPGLVGALLTGVAWAKSYAYALDLPLIPVNHVEGHVCANYLAHPDLVPSYICLVASGGHSDIVMVDSYGEYRRLGGTVDDAAGEAFDKVARVLGIPYPGGPLLDELAESGEDSAYSFPRIKLDGHYDYSFSGLKTAAINLINNAAQRGDSIVRADFAASFRRAVVGELIRKLMLAAEDTGTSKVALSGGVAANRLLRRELDSACGERGYEAYMPPPALCTDNAAMIGSAGFYRLMTGHIAGLNLNAQPSFGDLWAGRAR